MRQPNREWLRQRMTEPFSDDCVEWPFGGNGKGYGMVFYGGSMRLAHRVAYEMANHPIPEGMAVCHSCDNPPCINPKHLWLGTRADNNADRVVKGRTGGMPLVNRAKTHCTHGHSYDEENTYRLNGKRYCRECIRLANRRSYQKRKARRDAG